ncbi:MAG: hemerythrin domain-containing protein [Blastocatellales bacterium]
MKRHRSLHSLSRDHHQALVQARHLRLAAEANDPDNLAQAAARFAGYWEDELQDHFLREELILLPLLAKHASPENDELRETLRQHAEITRLVAELNGQLARRTEIESHLLDSLGEALRLHIRFEENALFPKLEATVPEEELERMGEQLETEQSRTGQGGCALSPKRQATEE